MADAGHAPIKRSSVNSITRIDIDTNPLMINTMFAMLLQEHGGSIMPKIIFWLLLILWAIGTFPKWENENVLRGTALIQIILFGILGYYTFSF